MSAPRRLLVFGGAFDPPHKGHMNLLENAVQAAKPDMVLVVPSGTSPHKSQSGTPWALRAAMCRCFLPVFQSLVISDIEERRTGKSYTYDTVCALQKMYPGADILLCMGSDMLESFTTWHRWKELLRLVTLVATPRCEDEVCELRHEAGILQSAGGRVLFAPGPVVQASSSVIRAAVAAGDANVLALVPPPADALVREKGLYGTGAGGGQSE